MIYLMSGRINNINKIYMELNKYEVKEIVWKAYLRGFCFGLLFCGILGFIHEIVTSIN